ncbi:unnamed protein product, partial [Cylindrotheca closterium]
EKCTQCLVSREKRNNAVNDLPDDMEWLKAKVRELSEHTGLPVEAEGTPVKDEGSNTKTDEEA